MADKYSRIKPEPCKGCRHHDWDSNDEYSPIFHYCKKGLFLPTSDSCKRKESFRSEELKPYKKCPLCGSSMTPEWVQSLGIHKSYCSNNLDCTLHAILLTDEEIQRLSPSSWISCKDRLPEEGSWVIAATFVFVPVVERKDYIAKELFFDGIDESGYRCWLCDGDWPNEVTHWQPLPSPPDKEGV